ncbi:keratin-associated protein 26-1 [Rhynchocyon petersi]
MTCHIFCSGNYSSVSLRNHCHVPVTSCIAICPASVKYGDAICLPSRYQGSSWLLDKCQESCNEPTGNNCSETASCGSWRCEASCYPSAACYVPRPCQGAGFLPVSSFISSSCLPVSCRPLNVSSGCLPLSALVYNSHSLGCVSTGNQPQNYFSNSWPPLSLSTYGCRPLGGLACGPQPLSIVSSSVRPLQPLSNNCQLLIHVFNTCPPSCFAFENW